MEDYLKFWPSIAGVFFVALVGTLAWPTEEEGQVAEIESLPLPRTSKPPPDPRPADEDVRQERKVLPFAAPDPQVQVTETVVAVPVEGPQERQLHAGDSDVQGALKQINIEVYKADWCDQCQKAIKFLEHNELKFTAYDVEGDWALKEKARRLSGQSGIPVIVIDGDVSVGFSEKEFSESLSAAVERRVLESAQ